MYLDKAIILDTDMASAFAKIDHLDLHSILRALWKSGLKSKDDVKTIIRELEDKDNTQIKDSHLIFE